MMTRGTSVAVDFRNNAVRASEHRLRATGSAMPVDLTEQETSLCLSASADGRRACTTASIIQVSGVGVLIAGGLVCGLLKSNWIFIPLLLFFSYLFWQRLQESSSHLLLIRA